MEYTDKNGSRVRCKEDWFIERAISEAIGYNDKTKLLIAIEQGLPELLKSEKAREVLAILVENGAIKARGHKPNKNKLDDERNLDLWKKIHYWKGRGLAVFDKANSKSNANANACDKAVEGVNISPERAHKIYLEMGGKNPSDNLEVIAKIHYLKGESER